MVTKKEEIQLMTQEQRDQQWEVVGLYCVFVFKKGQYKTNHHRSRNPFDNMILRREVIDVKNWE
jgi:hypothetical protein